MDPLSPLSPTLRIDALQPFQGDKQQQPPPFSRGQTLQGTVIGKKNDQFILEVKGEQFVAESKTPLHIGLRLELQVEAITPRITLQVLGDPLTQNIGKSLHLLPKEGQLLSQTSTIAANVPENTISPVSERTLDFFSSLAPSAEKSPPQTVQAGLQLSQLISDLFTGSDGATQKNTFTQIQNLIQQLTLSLPPQHQAHPQIQQLQQTLSEPNITLQQIMGSIESPEPDTPFDAFVQDISQLVQNTAQVPSQTKDSSTFVELLLQFMRTNETASTDPLLEKLLSLTKKLLIQEPTIQDPIIQKPVPTGKELQQFVNRLGTNLEQLLAVGKHKEATQTLKAALLEISHATTSDSKIQPQAEHLTSTIQLYQMLQIKLAGEDLTFLPLPLPFLNQGFLLIEDDQQQGDKQSSDRGEQKKYSLHLNLEGLGNLQVDLQQQTGGMRVRFFAEDVERAKFLSDNRDELQEWLTATTLESVQFLTGAEDPTKQLLSRMTCGQTGLLNTRA